MCPHAFLYNFLFKARRTGDENANILTWCICIFQCSVKREKSKLITLIVFLSYRTPSVVNAMHANRDFQHVCEMYK